MRPDFDREVHCLLGLPFDALGLDEAARRVRRAARERRRCFLSTPNLNFVIAAQDDAAFRQSVLASDLSLIDGMPLVWIARLLGLPLRERVAGASLFERLRRGDGGPALRLFFFGGEAGVARQACARLNADEPGAGLVCAGFDAPGFEPVEAMSGEERIAAINASGADFVVAALGAKKGQAWIERNRRRLEAPVISHLGAVLNFVAGTVRRAPAGWQRVGMEWLWRIREEPALWRRYAADGLALARLLATRVLPALWLARFAKPKPEELQSASASLRREGQEAVLVLGGACSAAHLAPLRAALREAADTPFGLRLDLEAATQLDSAAIALLALLWASRIEQGRPWRVTGIRPRVARQLRHACADYLLQPQGVAAATGRAPNFSAST